MNLVSVLKAIVLPHQYAKNKCDAFRHAFIVMSALFIAMYVALVANVVGFVSSVYDEFTEFVENTDDFAFTTSELKYSGDKYTGRIDSLNISITIDAKSNEPVYDNNAFISVFIGKNKLSVSSELSSGEFVYSDILSGIDEADLTKSNLVNELESIKLLVKNTVISSSILVFFIAFNLMILLVLLISAVVVWMFRTFKTGLSFKNALFLTLGSLFFPIVINAVILVIPGGFTAVAADLSLAFRFSLLIILTYITVAFIPLIRNSKN